MPEMPQAAPAQAAPAQPGAKPAAPFGQTSAMAPTANKGAEAAAMQKLAMGVKLVGDAFAAAGATSELGQKILEILPKLSKLVPAGASTPATERNTMQDMAMKQAAQNQQMQQFRQQQMAAQQQKPPMAAQPGMAA
jgi:hypothetical protein